MKGVPIKFRGRVFASNEVVFGDYITHKDGSCAIRVRDNDDLFNMHEYEIAVEKRSVAQLVGYDADGKEVYEGDIIFDDEFAETVPAEIYPCAHLQFYKLKENNND